MANSVSTARDASHHHNIFKSMKDIDFNDTISHECGVTMNDSVEARAIAELMDKKPGVTVTYQPALIRIETGFNTIERNAEVAKRYPERFIVNGAFDPRDGEKALEYIHYMKETYDIKGVKLYTAEWNGASKGWRLNDPDAYRCFELCEKLGIRNMHVHKGPTIIPLNLDAFDVRDVDYAAMDFQCLNWIIEHCGLPRLDEFCWIATQETNVYGGLAVALPFIHSRPRYFAEVIAELLFWIGPDKLLFGSDYAIWTPRWLVEKFWAFELPEDIRKERGVDLNPEVKEKILGLNAARLYRVDVAEKKAALSEAPIALAAE